MCSRYVREDHAQSRLQPVRGAFWRRVAPHIKHARKVSARLGRDLAFPRYFACPCVYVTSPNDAYHNNGREKRGLQIRPHSLVIGLPFERTNPGTGESLINDHGLTVSLVDVKQEARRFGGILVCAHDEPEAGFAWSAVGRPKHVSVPNTDASSLIAKVKRTCVWLVVCVIVGGTDGLGKWSALNESLPGRIFISYRRQLYDVLVKHFPAEQVFKDVNNIDTDDDFVELITVAVASCSRDRAWGL